MPNPKRRHSKARRDRRRTHDSLRAANAIKCENCGEMRLSHRACDNCGHYRQREVIQPAQ